MGIGDELMAAGEAEVLVTGTDKRTAIIDERPDRQRHRWHPIWERNPHIARPGESFDFEYVSHPGHRPYIQGKTMRQWTWVPYRPLPGKLFFSPQELAYSEYGKGGVVIQPVVKAGASPNKQWRLEEWQALIERMPRVRWVQVGDGTEPRLAGVTFIRTPGFREAAAVLSGARAAVLLEGGLHHAAAAVNTPAVVVFGGFISPEVTGYAMQRNIFVPNADTNRPLGCGMRIPCSHCFRAMLSIKASRVATELEELLCTEIPTTT